MDLDDDELWDEIEDLDDLDDIDEPIAAATLEPTKAPTMDPPKPVVMASPAPPIVARKTSEIRTAPEPNLTEKPVTQPLSVPDAKTPDVPRNIEPDARAAAPERPPAQVKKIWDLEPGTTDSSHLRPVTKAQISSAKQKPDQPIAAAAPPTEVRAAPRAGRVKTRLLGFEQPQGAAANPFEASNTTAQSAPIIFPVGWMVVTKGPGRGNSFSLFNGVSQVGRGDDQAIKLDFGDNSISRSNHAAIAYDAEQRAFYLGHGGKANLVRLNDKPVLSTEELSNGDLIRIGETTLRFVAFCDSEFDWDLDNQGETSNAAIA
ncbi:MAG: FHA domain-containing protein [Marinosulfonomonas sp.]|nr:FHA domain-containing protein [Marinosulfonomonas sp.]